jgi:hypothetical protein
MNRFEEVTQRAVVAHLNARAMPGVFWFHCPMGGYRRKADAAILKAMGAKPGVPDIIAINRGTVHALELKHLNGKLSTAQKATLDALELAGARVAVAYTLDEALVTLETWGVLRRDAGRSVIHRVPEAKEPAEA